MKANLLIPILVLSYGLSMPGVAVARGSGGHGGGSGGHGGGHSGGGHSGGGGGHVSSQGSSGGGAARTTGTVATRGPAVTSGRAAQTTPTTGQPIATRRPGGTVVGTAVPRGTPGTFRPLGVGLTPFGGFPYYGGGYGFYGNAFGFGGLGLYGLYGTYGGYGPYYDPFGFGYGYGYPGAFGYGGYGYGYPNSYSYDYPNSYASSPSSPSDPSSDSAFTVEGSSRGSHGPSGGLRLKIEPRNAQVYVDGYYAGVVDDFDGRFQQLKLASGRHRIEVRATGHEPLKFDVNIQSHQTTVYQGTLVP
jgi:hypothetical protein